MQHLNSGTRKAATIRNLLNNGVNMVEMGSFGDEK